MQINIQITDDRIQKIDEMPSYEGRITIGDFAETIFIPIDLWNKEDYEKQWRDGLKRIQTHETSCLVTLIYDPYTRPPRVAEFEDGGKPSEWCIPFAHCESN